MTGKEAALDERPRTKIRSPGAYRWFHYWDEHRSIAAGARGVGGDYSLCGIWWRHVRTVEFDYLQLCEACEKKAND